MLLGGDSVADTALLQAGATGELFDQTRAPSTIGSWLRAFNLYDGHTGGPGAVYRRPGEVPGPNGRWRYVALDTHDAEPATATQLGQAQRELAMADAEWPVEDRV
jgi:hypothetical protein